MAKGVNIYELTHAFWEENEYEPFSTAEIALFFFLLERANCRRWKMPVKCPTSLASRAIGACRQTVITAREKLRKRGLITFSEGKGNVTAPSYTVIPDHTKWTDGLTDDMTEDKTDSLTADKTNPLTDSLTTYNIEDNKIQNKDIISSDDKDQSRFLSLEKLEKIFLSDTEWHTQILAEIPGLDKPELMRQIPLFFSRLRSQGKNEREENDCRSYFINSLKKYFRNNGNKQSDASARRGTPVSASSARDYDAPF